ncbi:MAG: hypothetical protein ACLR2E_06615 [Lachnospiraceae bacterium]
MRKRRQCGKLCPEITAAAAVSAGCDACAGAIASGGSSGKCLRPVGGDAAAAKIAEILGKR